MQRRSAVLAGSFVAVLFGGGLVALSSLRAPLGETGPAVTAAPVSCASSDPRGPVIATEPGTWSRTESMRCLPVVGSVVHLADDRVLVTGGCQFPEMLVFDAAEVFDPVNGGWTQVAPMSVPRADHTSTLLPDGTVLVAGGRACGTMHGRLASAERFDPATGTWSPTGGMLQKRAGHVATLLPDGTVLVVGDDDYDTEAGEAVFDDATEIYDPATGTWTAGPPTARPHYRTTAVALLDGRVLVIEDGDAELYDPASRTWAMTGSLIGERFGGDPVVLSDGRVLVAGEEPRGEQAWFTSEVYDPVTGAWTLTTSSEDGLDCAARTARWPCGGQALVALPDGSALSIGGSAGGIPLFGTWHTLTTTAAFDAATGGWHRIASMHEARLPAVVVLESGRILAIGGNLGNRQTVEIFAPGD